MPAPVTTTGAFGFFDPLQGNNTLTKGDANALQFKAFFERDLVLGVIKSG
jgi:hypothetical protein